MISFITNYKEKYNDDIKSCVDDLIDNVIDNLYDYYKNNNIYNIILINKRLDKYSNYLVNTKYIDNNNILETPLGSYVIYITKDSLIKKSGFLVKIISEDIYKIKNYNKTWIIYTDKYYLFYKEPVRDKLRELLNNLVNNDFRIKNK